MQGLRYEFAPNLLATKEYQLKVLFECMYRRLHYQDPTPGHVARPTLTSIHGHLRSARDACYLVPRSGVGGRSTAKSRTDSTAGNNAVSNKVERKLPSMLIATLNASGPSADSTTRDI